MEAVVCEVGNVIGSALFVIAELLVAILLWRILKDGNTKNSRE